MIRGAIHTPWSPSPALAPAAVLPATVSLGHKLARRALTAGEKILRYGAPIGHATRDVAKGEHLHTHNLESDYLPTYTLDAGHAYVEHDD